MFIGFPLPFDELNSDLDDKLSTSGGTITGEVIFQKNLVGEPGSTNHAIKLGHANDDVMNFYEHGGLFQFFKSQSGTNTLLGKITSDGWVGKVSGFEFDLNTENNVDTWVPVLLSNGKIQHRVIPAKIGTQATYSLSGTTLTITTL